jgi:hypothetical protein
MADKLELLIQRMSRADKLRATDKRAADRIAARKRLGEYDPNSRMAQKARNDMIMAAIEMMESGYEDGGEVKGSKQRGMGIAKRGGKFKGVF